MLSRKLRLAVCAMALAASPVAAQTFVEVTDQAGLATTYDAYFFTEAPMQNWMAGGVAVGDYDGDGWEDVAACAGDLNPLKLFRNEGDGTFRDKARSAGVAIMGPFSHPIWADYDNDGDLDLFVLSYNESMRVYDFGQINGRDDPGFTDTPSPPPGVAAGGGGGAGQGGSGGPGTSPVGGSAKFNPNGPDEVEEYYRNYLFENQGDGTFIDRAYAAGLLEAGHNGATWGDLDDDGLLDLVVTSWRGDFTRVLVNQGDGTFSDNTPGSLAVTKLAGFHNRIVDFDEDGDKDILCICDFTQSRIWRNEGGWVFSEHDKTASLGIGLDENGMGSGIGDYDNDGDFDWFVTSIYSDTTLPFGAWGESGNKLYENDGDGTFTERAEAAGVDDGGWGWGAKFGDIDNDGWLDIAHANGFMPEKYSDDLLRVFMNNTDGTFTEQAVAMGINDPDQGRGLCLFDYDKDGDLDILVNNRDTGLTLYQSQGTANNFLAVRLSTDQGNRFGIGAIVKIRESGGNQGGPIPNQKRLIEATSNYQSQSPCMAWFGLETATEVILEIDWPSGLTTTQTVAANQHLTVVEPQP